jgi:3-dehydroquinate synthase
MKKIEVNLPGKAYQVLVGMGVLDHVADELAHLEADGGVIIADRAVAEAHMSKLALSDAFKVLTVEPGEASKSLDTSEELLNKMASLGVTRDDVVITLGGGMVGDLGGFAASIYMRGLRLFHVPTTVLSQVDSCIGGKTGVNLPYGKNLVGTFHQPAASFVDPSTLTTLGDREYRSGFAEVLKYGWAFGDDMLASELDVSKILARDHHILEEVIARCLGIKADVVARDEFDRLGHRALLNYGHTFGHALEAAGSFALLHGEAVGLGMIFAAELSVELGMGPSTLPDDHRDRISSIGLPVEVETDLDSIRGFLELDKKASEGTKWVLLRDVGAPEIVSHVPDSALEKAVGRLCP